MKFEIPDVKLSTLTYDQLKEHASICAEVDNQIRAYHIEVQSEIIHREHAEHDRMRASGELVRTYPTLVVKNSQMRKPTAKEILEAESDDDDFPMDFFK